MDSDEPGLAWIPYEYINRLMSGQCLYEILELKGKMLKYLLFLSGSFVPDIVHTHTDVDTFININ